MAFDDIVWGEPENHKTKIKRLSRPEPKPQQEEQVVEISFEQPSAPKPSASIIEEEPLNISHSSDYESPFNNIGTYIIVCGLLACFLIWLAPVRSYRFTGRPSFEGFAPITFPYKKNLNKSEKNVKPVTTDETENLINDEDIE